MPAVPSRGDAGNALDEAIVQAVTYSDVFSFPLTAVEIHRYLAGVRASFAEVCDALTGSQLVRDRLTAKGDYYALAGRESIVETRLHRALAAEALWPRALAWGRRIAALPFVRMVAVTGALSVNNSETDDDLDYLIVTEPGRLWLCRAFVIALVRLAARRGDVICPNYLLSLRALVVGDRNIYTAREMTQMVPLAGLEVYEEMRRLNGWVDEFLPNAGGLPRKAPPEPGPRPWLSRSAEALLRTPVGGRLERWEMGRKLRKLSRQSAASFNPAESDFGPDWCKGHFHSHGTRTISAVDVRLGGMPQ